MKLFEIAVGNTLYHRMSKANFKKLQADGELFFKRKTFCCTRDKNANADKEFGEILLAIDANKLVERGAKFVDMVYDLDWMVKNDLLKHVTGMNKKEYIEYVKMSTGASDDELEEVANDEIKEAYEDEKEVVVYIDKLLFTEIKQIK